MNVGYDAHIIAVSVDWAGLGQRFGVAEIDVISVLRGKEAGALQEIDNKEKDYQGDDARKSDFYFT
jgi:hypothetical protein